MRITTTRKRTTNAWLVWLLLLGLTYLSSFLFMADYGFYYDDHYSLGFAQSGQIYRFWELDAINAGWGHGRPLYFFVRSLFFNFLRVSYIDTIGLYFLNLLLQTALAFSFYLFFRRRVSQEFAVIGAVLFAVYPAFTCQAYLTNALYQVGLFGALACISLYLTQERWKVVLSYALFPLLLLYVEMPALLFVGAPLMVEKPRSSLRKKWLWHLAIVAALLALVLLVRRFVVADSRMSGSSGEFQRGVEIYRNLGVAKLIVSGIWTSIAMFGKAAAEAVQAWRAEMLVLACGASLLLYGMFSALGLCAVDEAGSSNERGDSLGGWRRVVKDPSRARLVQYALIGLCLAVLGYLLAPFMRIDVTSVTGRETRIHETSMVGIVCFLASVTCLLLGLVKRRWKKGALLAALAVHLGLVTAYRFEIQSDYREAWSLEQSFYQRLWELAPDLSRKTLVIVDNRESLPETRFVDAYYGLDVSLSRAFQFPDSWSREEIPFLHFSQWPLVKVTKVEDSKVKFYASGQLVSGWLDLEDGNVIVLSMRKGRLVRRTEPIDVDGIRLNLKPFEAGARAMSPGHFFDLFVKSGRERL